MPNINDLLDLIRENPPKGKSFDRDDWREILSDSIPNWVSLVQDESNWSSIERVRPRNCYYSLCELFVNTIGIKLVKRWFNSNVADQRNGAIDWLEHLNNFTPEVWRELNNDMKEYVINYNFVCRPGEPFETYRDLLDAIRHSNFRDRKYRDIPMLGYIFNLPPMRYIPSELILNLRLIIKNSGDTEFLRKVENMIAESKKVCELSQSTQLRTSLQIPYLLSMDEKELIARVMDKFRRRGYSPSPLPEIYLSYESPPLFVAYPELEKELEETEPEPQEEPIIPRNRERGKPETISIEELFGCYIPNPKIVLYARGMSWFARKFGIDDTLLRMVVLVHEIGHWVTHLLPKRNVPSWPTELFKATSEEVTEGWAQLITWWVVDEIGGEIKQTFEKLNTNQSSPYRIYEDFKASKVSSVIDSLEILRRLNWPAGIEDWKKCIK